ncbi:MAG: Ig-like domain repeat protein [Ginsengibacter sp.]
MKTTELLPGKNAIKSKLKNMRFRGIWKIHVFLLALLFHSAMSFADPITIDTGNKPPDGKQGTPYSFCFTATGDLVGATWKINPADALPPGLVLSTAGCISGTPTAAGTYTFRVDVINSSGNGDEETFTIAKIASSTGEPHITTVDGVNYALQSAGEFVLLRGKNLEIQTRQTPITTPNYTFSDPYTGLSTCVSINSAVAAQVSSHRVTYQPNINGVPDSSGMQLRVDGKLTNLTTMPKNGIDLGSGGRIIKSAAGGGVIEIDFPDGTILVVTPYWWPSFKVWYLNLNIYHTGATEGLMGVIAPRSWLPRLPDGTSLGPKPTSPHDRFVELNDTFANAWRVTDKTSLFDYQPGTSTATFTNKAWPSENVQLPCIVAGQTPLTPIALEVAQQLCRDIIDSNMRANAIFDVMVTGEPTFAKAYLLTQQVQTSTTTTTVFVSKDTTNYKEPVTFTVTVNRKFSPGKDPLAGNVEFTIDGKKFQEVKLDANGRAVLTTTSLEPGQHHIIGTFMPASGSTAFSSSSFEVTHTVLGGGAGSIFHHWWFWLIILLIIVFIVIALLRKKKSP